MRLLLLAALLSLPALADVGPRPPACAPPSTCVSCTAPAGSPDEACVANATDAGLVVVDCSDRSGSSFTNYYCPPGTSVGRGCSAAPAGSMVVLAMLVALRRRRASSLV